MISKEKTLMPQIKAKEMRIRKKSLKSFYLRETST